jgi:hypothetical protein
MNLRTCITLLAFVSTAACAQNSAKDAAAAQQRLAPLKEALSAGAVLDTTSNVADSLNIEAVMLPSDVVKRVFGREVSDNYAVIEVNIANRNPGSAFILHSLYIDYGRWALAQGYPVADTQQTGRSYTSRTISTQVSSVEYRIIRGEVMDRQPFTTRNLIINTMKGIGAAGTAFAFPFTGDVSRGISAWNGGVVPALEAYWPDSTQGQLNRISDYGFRNNKVVPQQSADIVVAFFPISRFVFKPLKQLFLKNPAAFFSPLMLALDPNPEKGVREILESSLGGESGLKAARTDILRAIAESGSADFIELNTELRSLQASIAADHKKLLSMDDKTAEAEKDSAETLTEDLNTKQTKVKALSKELQAILGEGSNGAKLLSVLETLSLSNVSIVVSGTMNADEQVIPASIMESCFDKPTPELWAEPGTKTCTLRGRYLLNATPRFLDSIPSDIGLSDIAIKGDASSADLLTFTYKLKAAIKPPVFDLVVSKPGKSGASVDSMRYGVKSTTVPLPPPTIDSAKVDGSGKDASYIVTGTNFFSVKPDSELTLNVKLSGTSNPIAHAVLDSRTQITLPASDLQALKAGCYVVEVKVGPVSTTNDAVNLKIDDAAAGATGKIISNTNKCS